MTVYRLVTTLDKTTHAPGAGLLAAIRAPLHRAAARVRGVRAERWWALLFAMLFLTFFVVLLFQPAVGRGGR